MASADVFARDRQLAPQGAHVGPPRLLERLEALRLGARLLRAAGFQRAQDVFANCEEGRLLAFQKYEGALNLGEDKSIGRVRAWIGEGQIEQGVGLREVVGDAGLGSLDGKAAGLDHRRSDIRRYQETLDDELVLVCRHVEISDYGGEGKMEFGDSRDLVAGPLLHRHGREEDAPRIGVAGRPRWRGS